MTAALTTVAAPDLEPALTAFRAAVAAHDLTYRYSDDPHEYRRGAASFRRIQDLARALPADVVAREWDAVVDRTIAPGSRALFYWAAQ